MRVLHAIQTTDPAMGGPIEGLKQLARALKPLGVEVEVVSVDDPDASPWIADFPLKVYAMGPGQGKFGRSEAMLRWLGEHGKEYDRIVVNGLWQFNGLAVWRTRKAHGRPYVVFSHGMLDPWFRRTYPLKHLKKQLYWLAGQHRVLRDAAAVLYTSEEERLQAQDGFVPWGPFHERVIAYGTAGSPYDPEKARETFLEAHPELRDTRNLLFLSRIHVKKGCDLLLRAFARHADRDPDLRLVMAGPDETGWRAELEGLAAELGVAQRIVWPGMLKDEMKWGAYAAAEAFALPSHQENFGIVVAEALASGLPVLISDKVNIWREIVEDGAGLAAPDDQDGTDRTMDRYLSLDAVGRTRMGEAARACFRNRYEIGHAAQTLLDVYRSLA